MEQDGLTFPLAVKKLLKEKLHIDLSDSDLQSTPEEEERYKKLESMRIINERLCAFFCQEIGKETPDAKSANAYMLSRWNEEYCKEKISAMLLTIGHPLSTMQRKKALVWN